MSYLNLAKRIQAGLKPVPKAEPVADATEGRIVAVKVASEVLGADIWLVLHEPFDVDDSLAVFYPEELPFLKAKDAETLREIHESKLRFPGSRVRQ
jgi:hypothetical protein